MTDLENEGDKRKNCLWSGVQIDSYELCGDGQTTPNINYRFKPYSWWWCCDKMKEEMNKSVFWNDHQAYLYIEKRTGCEDSDEIIVNNCPFCGKPIKIEQTARLQYWKKIVSKRYGENH